MAVDYVAAVRNAYAVAEHKDLEGWIDLFTPAGEFTGNSVGVTYRGRDLAEPVHNYGVAFSNMHRALGPIYTAANVVVVQLALQGTHDGPLQLPFGELRLVGDRRWRIGGRRQPASRAVRTGSSSRHGRQRCRPKSCSSSARARARRAASTPMFRWSRNILMGNCDFTH